MAQRVERRGVSHLFYQRKVAIQAVFLLGKVGGEGLDKGLSPVGQFEFVSAQPNTVVSTLIEPGERDVSQTEITHETV